MRQCDRCGHVDKYVSGAVIRLPSYPDAPEQIDLCDSCQDKVMHLLNLPSHDSEAREDNPAQAAESMRVGGREAAKS